MVLINGELIASDVTLNVELESSLNAVLVDRNQLIEVLLNLVLNGIRAAKTMPPEFRRVTIRACNGGRELLVSVSDRGPGISDELVESVFEPFVSRSGDGLGMGLPICRRIIERHGGKIWFEHRQGGGAVFKFTLPFAEAGSVS
jgi:signal transduction histidine kinase